MAGHSKFKNIAHRKGAQDAKRAKLFTKLIREILVAAKNGGEDAEFNPRLRTTLATAREANLPKQRIDAAIKKTASSNKSNNLEEITYECYLSGGVALIIETLTDNKNRTSSDIKSALNKYGSTLAASGAALYLFEKVGFIEFKNENIAPEKILETATEVGGNDCDSFEDMHQIVCKPDNLQEVQNLLAKKFGNLTAVKLIWKPKTSIMIDSQEQTEKILNTVTLLEDNDDVQNIYGNYVISGHLLTN